MREDLGRADIGKAHHHCMVIDAKGNRPLSRRAVNDETVLLELIRDVTKTWDATTLGPQGPSPHNTSPPPAAGAALQASANSRALWSDPRSRTTSRTRWINCSSPTARMLAVNLS
ncbi:hypothetical protein SAMN05216266_11461 [Amycolatopsis marina]|uniref:Transposase n=1 Tax=Amycolatopsis marina TaxID=490629 RepID=A0A1I1BMF2_9PSEU|nr:hypothetical protein SAMN05216266_11461 [Amycolatopsis marina]